MSPYVFENNGAELGARLGLRTEKNDGLVALDDQMVDMLPLLEEQRVEASHHWTGSRMTVTVITDVLKVLDLAVVKSSPQERGQRSCASPSKREDRKRDLRDQGTGQSQTRIFGGRVVE